MKKALKIITVTLLTLLTVLTVLPWLAEDKIEEIFKNKINTSLKATLDFKEAHLSLLKHFPDATVTLEDVSLVNGYPFEGDTLFASKKVVLNMSLKELFKGAAEPKAVKSLTIDRAKLYIIIDEAENANYSIFPEKEGKDTLKAPSTPTFRLALNSYAITRSEIRYEDKTNGTRLTLSEIQHSGTGDLSLEKSELNTTTEALVSFAMDSTSYLNRQKLSWDALIGINLKQNRYTFLENKALINQLPLVFTGFVQVNDHHQEADLTFTTPSSDFKNFLAVIPEAYSQNLETVRTTGNFEVNGRVKGVVDEEHIPNIHITLTADNASFRYPDLPKSVQNISLHTEINNTTGLAKDTYIAIQKLSFTIDRDTFNLSARITELPGNPKVNAHIHGTINLAHLSQAYPFPSATHLKGILKADITTAFDKESLKKKAYQNTDIHGNMTLTGFEYPLTALQHPVLIHTAALTFTPKTVALNTFTGKTGGTDFKVTGALQNPLGFFFNDEKITGNFKLTSNTVVLNDFRVNEKQGEETKPTSPTTAEEKIKIPAFLDCTLQATAATVLYDNLSLQNVTGTLLLKNETATLKNVSSELLGGTLGLSGAVSTQKEIPTFDLNLTMRHFNISESFASLDLFKVVAPLAQALEGTLNSDIAISGNLKDDFVPNLATISGNWVAELLSAQINTGKAPVFSALNHQLNFLNPEDIHLKNLKTALRFTNGAVTVTPFTLHYKDIAVQVEGGHTFDRQLNYTATLQVPASYLGKEVTRLAASMDNQALEGLTVPVTVHLKGLYNQPAVSTDITTGVEKLTARLIDRQKQRLLQQGKAEAETLLSKALQKKDTTSSSALKETLGRLLNHKPKDTATSKTEKAPATKTTNAILEELRNPNRKESGQ